MGKYRYIKKGSTTCYFLVDTIVSPITIMHFYRYVLHALVLRDDIGAAPKVLHSEKTKK